MIYELVPKPLKKAYKKLYWKTFYNIIGRYSIITKYNKFKYMNYGYAKLEDSIENSNYETIETLQAKLYLYLMQHAPINQKTVLEIGCGRGGGCYLFQTQFKPQKVTGIDISEKNISICKENYKDLPIEFTPGDAEKQIFPNNTFDTVLNLESSHCYPQRINFFQNVYSILKSDGYFIYSDLFWDENEKINAETQLKNIGFIFEKIEDITPNVVLSLEIQATQRKDVVKAAKWLPSFIMKNFTATTDSNTYAGLKSGATKYMLYILRK